MTTVFHSSNPQHAPLVRALNGNPPNPSVWGRVGEWFAGQLTLATVLCLGSTVGMVFAPTWSHMWLSVAVVGWSVVMFCHLIHHPVGCVERDRLDQHMSVLVKQDPSLEELFVQLRRVLLTDRVSNFWMAHVAEVLRTHAKKLLLEEHHPLQAVEVRLEKRGLPQGPTPPASGAVGN